MDYTALKNEIQTDPESMGYSAHLPEDHVSVAELLVQDDPAQMLAATEDSVAYRGDEGLWPRWECVYTISQLINQ
jgi:hypothetical protein